MITPSTEEARLAQIAQRAQGFLYYACQKGTTGMKESLPEDFAFHLERIRKHTSLPIVAGFGIASRSSAQEALQCADGFVVGSAIVRKMEERCAPSALKAFAETIDPRQTSYKRKLFRSTQPIRFPIIKQNSSFPKRAFICAATLWACHLLRPLRQYKR